MNPKKNTICECKEGKCALSLIYPNSDNATYACDEKCYFSYCDTIKQGIGISKTIQKKWKSVDALRTNPTQPLVCSRNDGISGKLDGITFPKWRNESIKALGNAIVPQVALQIFNAINLHIALMADINSRTNPIISTKTI